MEMTQKNPISTFFDLATINDAGTIIDVPGDGNCGFYVLLLGLKELKKDHCLISSSINDLRKQIHDYGEKHFEKLNEKMKYNWCLPRNSYEKTFSYWKRYILHRIYDSKKNFSNGASKMHWWECFETTGLVCDVFKINIIIYSLPKPRTQAFEYNEKEIKYFQKDGINDLDISKEFDNKTTDTISMVWTDECHFKFFKINN